MTKKKHGQAPLQDQREKKLNKEVDHTYYACVKGNGKHKLEKRKIEKIEIAETNQMLKSLKASKLVFWTHLFYNCEIFWIEDTIVKKNEF